MTIMITISLASFFIAAVIFAVHWRQKYRWFLAGAPLRHSVKSITGRILSDDKAPAKALEYAGTLRFFAAYPKQLKRLAMLARYERNQPARPLGEGLPKKYADLIEQASKAIALLGLLEDEREAPHVIKYMETYRLPTDRHFKKAGATQELDVVRSVIARQVTELEDQYRHAAIA